MAEYTRNMAIRHFECPAHDWSRDTDDEVAGYAALLEHEQDFHAQR